MTVSGAVPSGLEKEPEKLSRSIRHVFENALGNNANLSDLTSASTARGNLGLDNTTTAGYFPKYSDTTGSQTQSSFLQENTTGVGIGGTPNALFKLGGTHSASNVVASFTPTLAGTGTTQQTIFSCQTNVSPAGASLSALYGMLFIPTLLSSSSTVSSVNGIYARTDIAASFSGGAINSVTGIVVANPSNSSGSAITNNTGLHIEAITNGDGVTSGTIVNIGFNNLGATASAAAGGTVVNRATYLTVPSGSGAGTTSNYCLFLTGDGGSGGGGTTTNYAIFNESTADNYISGNLGLGMVPVNKLDISGSLGRGAPVTKTADFSLAATENWVINNKSGSTCTVTLPAASSWTGREVTFKTIQAQTLVSASSNVIPLAGGAAGTAILAATAGKWAILVSNGTDWEIMAAG